MKEFEKNNIIGLRTVDGVEIRDVSKHYFDRAFERKIHIDDVKDAIYRPIEAPITKVDELGRVSTTYFGADTTVVINPETGNVVTTYKTRRNIRKRNGVYKK